MSLSEIENEALRLSDQQLRKLIGALVSEKMKREGLTAAELSRRLDDKSPGAWISLDEAEKRFRGE